MNFFKRFYLSLVTWFATFLMNRTNAVLRYLIVLKGKDPDYVAPPPPPAYSEVNDPRGTPFPTVEESKAAWMVDLKARPSLQAFVSSDTFVKDNSKHPVLLSRKSYEEKQAKLAAQKAVKSIPVTIVSPPITTDVTEIGGDAIDSLREAVNGMEQSLGITSPSETDKD
jgi:hypothetical protein